MIRFIMFQRLSTKPLVALAVLALIVMASGGVTPQQADAQTPPTYNVRVTFDTLIFGQLDDCPKPFQRCDTADLQGDIVAETNGGSRNGRSLSMPSKIESGGQCFTQWGDTSLPQCNKTVVPNTLYRFADTPFCKASIDFAFPCTAGYGTNNN